MNIIHENEMLKALARRKIIPAKALHEALHAPVFVMKVKTRERPPEEIAWINEKIFTNQNSFLPTWVPFPTFRLSLGPMFYVFYYNGPDRDMFVLTACPEGTTTAILIHTPNGEKSWYRGRGYDAKFRPVDPKTLNQKTIDESATSMMSHLISLLLALSLKAERVVKVSPPDTPGKSVEWRLAREHYLILPPATAAAMARTKRAASDRDIALAAHWRRAHFRRLTSEKFTHKRNQYVPVRQTWVGPSEWTGLDKKIYKLME